MGSKGNAEYRARQRERERRRRGADQRAAATVDRQWSAAARAEATAAPAHRVAATVCGWCGGPITPRARGPIPKWCSATCRHRAWEQTRAASSGRSAVEIVERHVQVTVPTPPGRRDWPGLLQELGHQLDNGRIYDRDLAALAAVLQVVLDAYHRRTEALVETDR